MPIKKRVRLRIVGLLLALLLVVAGLFGAAAWRSRRTPEFYERRGDALLSSGDFGRAAQQYAAAVPKAGHDRRRAELLIKRFRALEQTRVSTLAEAFHDARKATEALNLAVDMSPVWEVPLDLQLHIRHRQAALLDTANGWETFLAQAEAAAAAAPANLAVGKYVALARVGHLRHRPDRSPRKLEETVAVAVEALGQSPDHAELRHAVAVAKLLLASQLVEPAPGRAYKLRLAAVDDLAAAESLDEEAKSWLAGDRLLVELLVEIASRRPAAADLPALTARLDEFLATCQFPPVRLRLARELLASYQIVPPETYGPGATILAAKGEQLLASLATTGETAVTAAFLLLNYHERVGNHAGRQQLLERWHGAVGIPVGVLDRQLAWMLKTMASRHRLQQLVDLVEAEAAGSHRQRLLSEVADELDLLDELAEANPAKTFYPLFLRSYLHAAGGERRRALQQWLDCDRLLAGREAQVKLAVGTVLLELGECGAAVDWLEKALALDGGLSPEARLKAIARLGDALVAAGDREKAKALAGQMLGMNGDGGRPALIAGRLWRALAEQMARGPGPSPRHDWLASSRQALGAAAANLAETPDWQVEMGRLELAVGNPAAALGHLRNCLTAIPCHPEALAAAMSLLLPEGDADSARDMLRAASERVVEPQVRRRLEFWLAQDTQRLATAVPAILAMLGPVPVDQMLAAYHDLLHSGETAKAKAWLANLAERFPTHERVVAAVYAEMLAGYEIAAAREQLEKRQLPEHLSALQEELLALFELARHHPYAAVERLEKSLRIAPMNSGNRRRLGEVMVVIGEHERAVDSYRQAIRLNPADQAAWLQLHVALDHLGRRQEARKVLHEQVVAGRATGELLGRYLDYLAATGEWQTALAWRRRVAEYLPAEEGNRRAMAWLLLEHGQESEAEALLRELAEQGEEVVQNAAALAECLARRAGEPAGLAVFEQALARLGGRPLTSAEALTAARLGRRLRLNDLADHYYQLAAVAAGEAERLAVGRETIAWWLASGRPQQAYELASQLVDWPAPPVLAIELAGLFVDHDSAASALRLLENAPEVVDTFVLRARAFHLQGDQLAMARAFERATRVSPRDPRPFIWRARLFGQSGEVELRRRAEMDLLQAIRLQPGIAEPYRLLARQYEVQGKLVEAEKQVLVLAQMAPDNEQYRLWRARILLNLGSFDGVARQVDEARARGFASPLWRLLAAQCEARAKQPSAALVAILPGLGPASPPEVVEFALELLVEQGLTTAAEKVMASRSEATDSAGLRLWRAQVAARQGREDEAMLLLGSALPLMVAAGQQTRLAEQTFRALMSARRLGRLAVGLREQNPKDIDTRLFLAAQAERLGAYREAVVMADDLTRLLPADDRRHRQALLLLATNALRSGQWQRALPAYEALLRQTPEAMEIANNLAFLLAGEGGNPERAERLVLAVQAHIKARSQELASGSAQILGEGEALVPPSDIISAPARAALLDTLALALHRQGRLEEAKVAFETALKLHYHPEILAHFAALLAVSGDPLRSRELLREAASLGASGNWPLTTRESLLSTLARQGFNVPADQFARLVHLLLEDGKLPAARRLFEELFSRHPQAEFIVSLRIELLLAEGVMAQAEQELLAVVVGASAAPADQRLPWGARLASRWRLEAVAANGFQAMGRPDQPLAWQVEAATWFEEAGQPELAAAIYGNLLATEPTARLRLACLWLASQDRQAASQLYLPRDGAVPDRRLSVGEQLLLAVLDGKLDSLGDSVRYVNADPTIRPTDLLTFARLLRGVGGDMGLAMAETLVAKALEMNPRELAARRFQAELDEAAQRWQKAIHGWQTALAEQPLAAPVVAALGRLLGRLGHLEPLAELLDIYRLFFADQPWFYTLDGERARLAGDFEAAVEHFATAFELAPEIDNMIRLVTLLLEGGRFAAANQVLKTAPAELADSAPALALGSRTAFAAGHLQAGGEQAVRALRRLVHADEDARPMTFAILLAGIPEEARVAVCLAAAQAGVDDACLSQFIVYVWPRLDDQAASDALRRLQADLPPASQAGLRVGLLLARQAIADRQSQLSANLLRPLLANHGRAPEVVDLQALFTVEILDQPEAASLLANRAVELAESGSPAVLSQCLETQGRAQLKLELLSPAHRSVARSVALQARATNTLLLAEILAARRIWLAAQQEAERAELLAKQEKLPSVAAAARQLASQMRQKRAGGRSEQ